MFDLKAISRLLLRPGVLPVFLVKVVSGFPSGESRAAPGQQSWHGQARALVSDPGRLSGPRAWNPAIDCSEGGL